MMTILQIYCVQRIGPANPHWAIYYFKAIVHNPNQELCTVKLKKKMNSVYSGFKYALVNTIPARSKCLYKVYKQNLTIITAVTAYIFFTGKTP